jgi:tellurite methyltransferase
MSDIIGDERYDWRPYYNFSLQRPPRDLLHRTLGRFEQPGLAIDLGCGAGVDGQLMLARGWRVLAVDQQETGVETFQANVSPEQAERLKIIVSSYKSLTLPKADLIWAGLSLPFCHPWDFGGLWGKIRGALAEGGRFAGDFFGPRHAWANVEKMTSHTKEEVMNLLDGLHLEFFVEEEGEAKTADKGLQHWHMYSVCARNV